MKKCILLLVLFLITIQCTKYSQKNQSQEPITSNKVVKNLLGTEVFSDSINKFIESNMKTLNVQGVSFAIINDGKIVHHFVSGYADLENKKRVTDKTIFEAASLSKPLFAYFTMMFVEEGKLDLDKPLYEYLPYEDIAYDDRYKKITARMVLSHTTGFPNWRTDDNSNSKLTIAFEPGTTFGYSGEGYQYLAKILAHIAETDDDGLEALYQEKIARPLSLKHTKFIQDDFNLEHKSKGYKNGKIISGNDDPAVFGAAYSIHSEAYDFSKWLIALMEQKGLNKNNFNQLFQDQVLLPEDAPHRQQGITNWTLGFAKATLAFGTVYGHGGNNLGFTSLMALNNEKKWGFIIFTNANQSNLPLQLFMYINRK